jgi:putative cardiolipin synthase
MQISAIPFGILRTLIRLAAIVSMMVLVGCAQLPTSVERPESRALLSPEGTTLGAIAKASVSGPDVSGFQLLPIAYFALEARLKLADMAERTIDVQYYLLQDDVVGKTLLQALQRASLRGVRVRILIDDLYSSGEDRILEDLAAFPNVEVRLFNPFPAGRDSIESRFVASALDFDRVDHRMHNKLFVADDAIAVAGGRNMADEYFMQSESNNFVDLDVIAAGPVAQQFSNAFDLYWNSRFVYPLESITHPTRPPAERRVDFGTLTANNPAIPVDTTFPARLRRYTTAEADLNAGRLHLTEAPVRVVADPAWHRKRNGVWTNRTGERGGVPIHALLHSRT